MAFDYKTVLQKANVSQRRSIRCDSLVGNYEMSNPTTTFKYAKEGVTYKMRRSTDEADQNVCGVIDKKNSAAFVVGDTYVLSFVDDLENMTDVETFACTSKDNEDNKVMYQCSTTVVPDDGTPITASMDFTKVSNGVLRRRIAVVVLAVIAVVALLL